MILKRILTVLCAVTLSVNGMHSQNDDLQSDLEEMMQWFEGEFDNFQQTWKENEDNVDPEIRHERIHSIFKKVDAPKLGNNVFYVKQFQNGDTTNIYRQRIYNFHINDVEQAIQLDIYSFLTPEDGEKYAMANHNPSILKDISVQNLRNTSGCEVYWKKNDDHFVGYMKDRTCHFTSTRSGKEIYITDTLKLTPDEIWIQDEAEDVDGNYIFGNKAGLPHKLKKCRFFKGWIAIEKAPKSDDYYFMKHITLHDQGQKVQLIDDKDGTKTKYSVELSEVIYASGIEVLKLAIYEEGKEKAPAYVWANPNAKQIGINIRTMSSGFTLVEAE